MSDKCFECGMIGSHYSWCTEGYIEEIQISQAVLFWQLHPMTHPLTCGNDDCKPEPYEGNQERKLFYNHGKLRCYHCGYEQDYVPDTVIEFYDGFLYKDDIE